jgi:hypothetical protein
MKNLNIFNVRRKWYAESNIVRLYPNTNAKGLVPITRFVAVDNSSPLT